MGLIIGGGSIFLLGLFVFEGVDLTEIQVNPEKVN